VIAFAREQQQCRYQEVLITPVVQRKTATETRFLTERESWEALNETWAVFVGWAIWTHLEVQKKAGRNRNVDVTNEWVQRLKKADHDGDLRGYYEPEDPAERAITHKRFLAPQFRISPDEVAFLMHEVLGQQREMIQKLVAVMEDNRRIQPLGGKCGSHRPE
jgi:integrase